MKVRVRTSTIKRTAVTVGIQGPAGASVGLVMADISDVDLSNLDDGAVLVYSAQTGKWSAQTLLNKQQVDMGDETF
jgi:hypothetical protein